MSMGKIGTMGKMRLKTAETTKTVEITEKKLVPEFRCRLFRPFRPYCP